MAILIYMFFSFLYFTSAFGIQSSSSFWIKFNAGWDPCQVFKIELRSTSDSPSPFHWIKEAPNGCTTSKTTDDGWLNANEDYGPFEIQALDAYDLYVTTGDAGNADMISMTYEITNGNGDVVVGSEGLSPCARNNGCRGSPVCTYRIPGSGYISVPVVSTAPTAAPTPSPTASTPSTPPSAQQIFQESPLPNLTIESDSADVFSMAISTDGWPLVSAEGDLFFEAALSPTRHDKPVPQCTSKWSTNGSVLSATFNHKTLVAECGLIREKLGYGRPALTGTVSLYLILNPPGPPGRIVLSYWAWPIVLDPNVHTVDVLGVGVFGSADPGDPNSSFAQMATATAEMHDKTFDAISSNLTFYSANNFTDVYPVPLFHAGDTMYVEERVYVNDTTMDITPYRVQLCKSDDSTNTDASNVVWDLKRDGTFTTYSPSAGISHVKFSVSAKPCLNCYLIVESDITPPSRRLGGGRELSVDMDGSVDRAAGAVTILFAEMVSADVSMDGVEYSQLDGTSSMDVFKAAFNAGVSKMTRRPDYAVHVWLMPDLHPNSVSIRFSIGMDDYSSALAARGNLEDTGALGAVVLEAARAAGVEGSPLVGPTRVELSSDDTGVVSGNGVSALISPATNVLSTANVGLGWILFFGGSIVTSSIAILIGQRKRSSRSEGIVASSRVSTDDPEQTAFE